MSRSRTPILVGAMALVLGVGLTALVWLGSGRGDIAGAGATQGVVGVPVGMAREPIPLGSAEPIAMTVYLDPTCGCCAGWVQHMRGAGFEVSVQYPTDLNAVKSQLGVRSDLVSCHTAVVNGYVVEGHVPPEDLRRFLAEAPAVTGISVPGMPVGTPGMEMGDQVDPYDVIAFTADGETRVFSSHR